MSASAADLHRIATAARGPEPDDEDDYRIAASVGPAFLARNRSGHLALLIPISGEPGPVGRRGGGFSLNSASRVSFFYDHRRWEQAAAVFECTDDAFRSSFIVLVADVARRLHACTEITWRDVVDWLDEWQTMLGRDSPLSPEQQLGLWGELWIIAHAVDTDLLLGAWTGPDGEASDFLIDAMGVEVKTSRRAHVHYVSQKQVESPVGSLEAYLLSMWIGSDPVRGISLAELVDVILAKSSDPAAFLKRIGGLGYSALDRDQYSAKFAHLETPMCFRASDVPRVRAADPGVSMLRYTVSLDASLCLSADSASAVWFRLWQRGAPLAGGGTFA